VTRRPPRGRAGLLALVLLVAACAPPTRPPATERGEIVIGIVGDPSSLVAEDPVARAIAALVVEPLVRRSATEDLEPRLAEAVPSVENGSAEIVDDGGVTRLVATFRLRERARWHDGAPIEAEDVRFAFDQDRTSPEGSDARAAADRIERVDVVDRRTVRVTYRPGERWDLYALAPRALPRHLLGDEDARARYAGRPVHAGAYWIFERVPGRIVLVAFRDHVIDRPAIDRIVVRTFSDRTAVLSALARGEIDVAPYPALEADLARTLDRSVDGTSLQVLYTQAQAISMLRLGPSFSEPAIRRAIALAIDRDRIARSVFAGRVRVPASYLVPPLWAAVEGTAPRGPDGDAARASLASAGYRRGTFGTVERDGVRLAGTILVPAGSRAMEAAARSVAADLAALGLPVDVSERPLAEILDRVRRGDFELALVPEAAEDPLIATLRYRGAVSEWFDILGDAARGAQGRSEQRALYEELQRLWSTASPAVPLYQVLKVDVAPARLDGVRPAAHGAPITWNAGEWRLAAP
jgi:peptide/nickel transport system substrate-binding protein